MSTEELNGLTVIEKARHDGSDWENAYFAISFECTTTKADTHIPCKRPLEYFVGVLCMARGDKTGQQKESEESSDGPEIHGWSTCAGAKRNQ